MDCHRVEGEYSDVSKPDGQVCSLELLSGGAERDSGVLESSPPAGVTQHAQSCTCFPLLHPAFQPILQSGWLFFAAGLGLLWRRWYACSTGPRRGALGSLQSPCVAESTAVSTWASSRLAANNLSQTASQHSSLASRQGRKKQAKPRAWNLSGAASAPSHVPLLFHEPPHPFPFTPFPTLPQPYHAAALVLLMACRVSLQAELLRPQHIPSGQHCLERNRLDLITC